MPPAVKDKPKRKVKTKTMSEVLRECITAYPSLRMLEKETKVPRQTLSNFLRYRTIHLSTADKLARFFKLRIVRDANGQPR